MATYTNNTDQNIQENFKVDQTLSNQYTDAQNNTHLGANQAHVNSKSLPSTIQYPNSFHHQPASSHTPSGYKYVNANITVGSHYRNPKDLINNTNDMNPMIMMSGEEGSASDQ